MTIADAFTPSGHTPSARLRSVEPDPDDVVPTPVAVRPVVSTRLGITRISWPDPGGAAFEFDLIRLERRSGDLTGEVTVHLPEPAGELVHRGRLNLGSLRSKNELAAHLGRRTRGQGADWGYLVDQACMAAIDVYRAGEPAILLREARAPEDSGWALPPLVLARHPTIIFGDGGTAKSYLALAAALSIHGGEAVMGIRPGLKARVAFLDYEFEAWEHRERMRLLVGQDMPDLVYVRCQAPLSEEKDRLRRIFAENEIRFVVVDSVGMACDGPPEEAASALGFFEALRSLQVGALCIAHINRTGDTERPFGSTFWHNGARLTWYAKKAQSAGGNSMSVSLLNKKSNTGPLRSPLGFSLTFDEDRTAIQRIDVRDVPELAGQLPLKDRMTRLLAAGAMGYTELAEALDAPYETVKKAAQRGRDDGRFVLIGGLDLKTRVGLAEPSGHRVPVVPGHVPTGSSEGGRDRGDFISPLSPPIDPADEVEG